VPLLDSSITSYLGKRIVASFVHIALIDCIVVVASFVHISLIDCIVDGGDR